MFDSRLKSFKSYLWRQGRGFLPFLLMFSWGLLAASGAGLLGITAGQHVLAELGTDVTFLVRKIDFGFKLLLLPLESFWGGSGVSNCCASNISTSSDLLAISKVFSVDSTVLLTKPCFDGDRPKSDDDRSKLKLPLFFLPNNPRLRSNFCGVWNSIGSLGLEFYGRQMHK